MAFETQGLIDAYHEHFPDWPPARAWRAPGRVNLIGEHTDYNLGLVLPIAIELSCCAVAAPNTGGVLRAWSDHAGEMREWEVEKVPRLKRSGDWTDYLIGVARELVSEGFRIEPLNLFIRSTVPVGGGLSSSAALEVACALALLAGRKIEPLRLAQICQRAETQFVGLPCGIMDQYVSLFGQGGAALRVDCRTLEHLVVALPPGIEIVAVNSMVKHDLASSAYAQRVKECAEAVQAIRKRNPGVESLRDVTSAELPAFETAVPKTAYRRARHVVSENERVDAFVAASARADTVAMGALMVSSHDSLRYDYEVSAAELDFLVSTAMTVPGVVGARLTGGGFGGCTVNLLRHEAMARFEETISRAYRERFGIEPKIYPCRPAAGAGPT